MSGGSEGRRPSLFGAGSLGSVESELHLQCTLVKFTLAGVGEAVTSPAVDEGTSLPLVLCVQPEASAPESAIQPCVHNLARQMLSRPTGPAPASSSASAGAGAAGDAPAPPSQPEVELPVVVAEETDGRQYHSVLSVQHPATHVAARLDFDSPWIIMAPHSVTLVVQNGREPIFGGVAYLGLYAMDADTRTGKVVSSHELAEGVSVWVCHRAPLCPLLHRLVS